MIKLSMPVTVFAVMTLVGVASAQVQISLGVRETGAGGGTFSTIGGNGGAAGGIEWINKDGQTLNLDGTWQKFTFKLTTDPVTGFAGSTANGVLDGSFGTIEHVRILNTNGRTEPITLFIDDISNTTTLGGTTTFGDFQGYQQGDEVIFQEPTYSGSTASNIVAGATSGVDNLVASRSASCRCDFQFVDGTATRWLRLTTFNAKNQPNPLIRFDDNSVVEFWARAGDCQEDLGFQGPGGAFAELCGTGMNGGETSVYDAAGAPANAIGAFALSVANQPDIAIFGGTLVSGNGLIFGLSVFADPQGRLSFPLTGSPHLGELAVQTLFLDGSTPHGIGFTNAIKVRLGQ